MRHSLFPIRSVGVVLVNSIDPASALVLFSGGQDSTVCLAWALERFARVETLGFDYEQRHRAELEARRRVRERMAELKPIWAEKLGQDHVLELGALAAISDTALTREVAIEAGARGLPTTLVPRRNLIFLAFPGALAYWRGGAGVRGGPCVDRFFRVTGGVAAPHAIVRTAPRSGGRPRA